MFILRMLEYLKIVQIYLISIQICNKTLTFRIFGENKVTKNIMMIKLEEIVWTDSM